MMNYLNSAWWFTVKKYIILTSAGGKVSGPLAEYIAGQTGGPLQVVAVLTGHRTTLTGICPAKNMCSDEG